VVLVYIFERFEQCSADTQQIHTPPVGLMRVLGSGDGSRYEREQPFD